MKKKVLSLLLVLILALSALPLTAHASAYTVTVTINGKGSVNIDPQEPEPGETVTVTAKADDGWAIAKVIFSDSEIQFNSISYESSSWTEDSNDFTMPEDNVTVTVEFKPVQETCSVSYHSNGGEGPMEQPTVVTGETHRLLPCGYTKEGYTFFKWKIDNNYYDPGDEIVVNKDLNVYAVWREDGSTQIDNSEDLTTTTIILKMVLTDKDGNATETIVSEETVPSSYVNPTTGNVEALLKEGEQTLIDAAGNYSGVENINVEACNLRVLYTEDNRIYNYFDVDGGKVLIIDGTYYHEWEITLALTADYTPAVMSYFSVWMSDEEQHANIGGGVTINYVLSDGAVPGDDGSYWESSTNQTVPEGTEVTLTAVPADKYAFKGWYQANVNKASPDDPHYLADKLISTDYAYTFTGNPVGEGEPPYICAVFTYTGVSRQGDQIQVWITDGGKAAVKYTPSEPNVYHMKAMDGTNFVSIGEVVQFYKGDEITVYQQAEPGYQFKGWYHVRIEWGPGDELPKYEGDVISTDPTFTYKPGVTVVEGDEEPLRYVCAVFEEAGDIPEILLGDADGDGEVTILDATTIQRRLADLAVENYVEAAVDADGDGDVSILDATAIQRWLADLPTNENIGKPIA